jgi:pimeloyl-ACP methyl ester carboxylesterase
MSSLTDRTAAVSSRRAELFPARSEGTSLANFLQFTLLVLIGQAGIPTGSFQFMAEASGRRIEVFTYKPAGYRDGPLIMVFHGTLRDADVYRDDARKMGDEFGAMIAAPRFDSVQFGAGQYQQGGLFQDGKLKPEPDWTWSLVPKLVADIRNREARPDMPVYLIGHSAGGQFVGRMAAFVPADVRGVVVANPSSHLSPTRDQPYPYGFGELPEGLVDDNRLKRYLARPLTIYLGTADTERDQYLDKSAGADRQGRSRLERGRNVYRDARELAEQKGWEFGWRLVEAPGIGHDHTAMFDDPACEIALFGRRGGSPRSR